MRLEQPPRGTYRRPVDEEHNRARADRSVASQCCDLVRGTHRTLGRLVILSGYALAGMVAGQKAHGESSTVIRGGQTLEPQRPGDAITASVAGAIEQSEKTDVLLAEFNALRDEINTNSQIVAQVTTISLTAASVLIGYGFQQHSWIIFLSPPVLLIPSLWLVTSQLRSTIQIATYIYAVLEPKLGSMRWERELFKMHQKGLTPKSAYTVSITGVYALITLACIVFAWIFLGDFTSQLVGVLWVASLVILFTSLIAVRNANKTFGAAFYSAYIEAWRSAVALSDPT